MHEFVLYSQTPASRHEQVLHILAGITASQPVNISEKCLVYQQLRSADNVSARKGQAKQPQQPQRRYYHKLVRSEYRDRPVEGWKLRVEETPDAGVKTVTSRSVAERQIKDTELERFAAGSEWYKLIQRYMVTGTRFVYGNVVIRSTRVYMSSQTESDDPVVSAPPSSENLEPLDPSGTSLIEAVVRVEDESSSTLRDRAMEELLGFAKMVEGAIDFHVPDRLALDTKVKGT